MADTHRPIAVIGGTGNLGWALVQCWVRAGLPVIIGSRGAEKAQEAAARIDIGNNTGALPQGMINEDAAAAAEVIVVTVPFASQKPILNSIAEHAKTKLIVDTTVPLMPPKVARVQMPEAGSAALTARAILGDGVRLVSAFHNVAAHKLQEGHGIECDVLVFGDDPADREIVIGLAKAAGLNGVHGGPLANSTAAEALTSVLIGINKRYKVDGAGITITGLAGQ